MNTSLVVIVSAIFICLLVTLLNYWYLNRVLNRISWIIHTFLTRRTIDDTDVEDTREAKLISQLKQLIMIADHEIKSSKEEKEAVTRLISDLSHQFKTPLANISMYAELLRESSLSKEEKAEFIERTREQAQKMQWLMNSLFHASRLETGSMDFEVTPTSIKETIATSITSVFSQAQEKNINICIEEFDNCLLLHNRKWTAEAITNILDNAIKYSPMSSTIQIQVERMEFFTRINIKDQGIGILPSEYNLIFKRYYRSKMVEQNEGTGLGLYIAQLILSKQGGYITVDSKLGDGSCFSVYLQNVA